MTNTTTTPTAMENSGIQACIRDLGFSPSGVGQYRRGGMVLGIEANWATFEMPQPSKVDVDPLSGEPLAGLWKYCTAGPEIKRRFDLPLSLLGAVQEPWSDQASKPLAEMLAWPIATAGGAPGKWEAPGETQIPLTDNDLIVRRGRFVRHGKLVRGDHDLRVLMPVIDRLPDDLPAPRQQWIRATLLDAQNRWRMIRILGGGPQQAIEAEVDLTGAPHDLIPDLARLSLDVLSGVVSWLIESVDLLADATVPLAAPELS